MTVDLWNKGYVTDEVSTVTVNVANLCEENRQKWVTDLAAVSRGKDSSKNPAKRYAALLKEAAPDQCEGGCNGEPSRPLEFLPVIMYADIAKQEVFCKNDKVIKLDAEKFFNYLITFSHVVPQTGNKVKLYTNMRAVLKAGVPYDDIPYNDPDDIKIGKFFAIKSYTPMFIWAQSKTHCRISSESASDRLIDSDKDYWLPSDLFERITKQHEAGSNLQIVDPNVIKDLIKKEFDLQGAEYLEDDIRVAAIEVFDGLIYSSEGFYFPSYLLDDENATIEFLLNWPQNKVTDFFKQLGYKKEIYNRMMYYAKYKLMVRTGWGIDPTTWQHYFLERGVYQDRWKNWAQTQIQEEAIAIHDIYKGINDEN